MKLHNVVISYASLVHFVWAALLLFTMRPILATPIAAMYSLLHLNNGEAALLLGTVSILAMNGAKRGPDLKALLMVIPQQTILFLSAMTGILAAVHGHYADGVPRPWEFILADQLPIILLGLVYTCGVLDKFRMFPKW